ncbi:MAG: hypothetical protein JWQ95_1636 [Sphaerisporangium sp.]|jgi:uncharacterized membrane-anchored protein|nr:hypothetical protein [Sphaerisporangium sp.]
MKKFPQITIIFWIMKIAATTLGETAGDLVSQTLNIGYAVSSIILIFLFFASLVTQLRAKKFYPVLYWTVILSTSTAGTTMSDFMNRTAGFGYAKGALLLITALAAIFVLWKLSGYTFDVMSITTFRGEVLFWTATLISNTLGTSVGDFLADNTGLGFTGGTILVSGILALIVVAHYYSRISSTLLFWTAFILTRPLGANVGNFFSKPTARGGMGYGTVTVSLVLLSVLVALIVYQLRQQQRSKNERYDEVLAGDR